MSDDLAVVSSDTLPTASVSSSGNAPSNVSQQLPQNAVDAWNVTFNAAKLAKTAQDAGWQPASLNPRPAEAASPSSTQHGGLNFALAPSKPEPTARAAAGATAKAPHSSTAGSTGATPSPIDPESLPPGPLNQADYERVGERNRYLASKYDPNNLYDRFINSFTGAMNDPANVRTPSERAEHEALSQKIIDTVFPQPTLAEARLNMMAASPIGTIASLVTGAAGGSQQAQDLALIGGSAVDTFGLGRGLQTGGPTSVTAGAVRSSGPMPMPAPETKGMPEEQLSAIGRSARETGRSLPVAFDGAFAAQQLLGTTTTPGGRQIMFHAADRMVNPPKGRIPMSSAEIDEVLDGATKVVKRSYHPEGNTLTIENRNMAGRPRVIVDEVTGQRVITVINPRTR